MFRRFGSRRSPAPAPAQALPPNRPPLVLPSKVPGNQCQQPSDQDEDDGWGSDEFDSVSEKELEIRGQVIKKEVPGNQYQMPSDGDENDGWGSEEFDSGSEEELEKGGQVLRKEVPGNQYRNPSDGNRGDGWFPEEFDSASEKELEKGGQVITKEGNQYQMSSDGDENDGWFSEEFDSGSEEEFEIGGQVLKREGVPIEILNMDDRSIRLFEEALKAGKENIHAIRVMVVGHLGVGKTTLIKRLLGKEVDVSERHSTEGIDVYVNCCDVSLSTLEWTQRKKDSEQDYRLQRLAKVLNEQQSNRDKVATEAQVGILPEGERTDSNSSVTNKDQIMVLPHGERPVNSHVAVEDKDTEVLYHRSPQQDFGQNLSSTASQQEKSPSALVQRKLTQSETNTMAMLKLLQENVDKLKPDTGKNSPLTIWDFAGQYAFYTTHQTFLTRRAIYLLVSDVSGQVTDLVADECYFDSEGIMKCKVHELIEVWLNSIHSCAPSPEAGIPPVILVGTHVDKISQKQLPAKGVESGTQTTTSETDKFNPPTTSTHAGTAINEQPGSSTILGFVRKVFKPRKTKRIAEMTPVSSITDTHAIMQPTTQGMMKKERVDADTEKRYRHEICERYFKEIRSNLSDKPTRFHLVDEDFAIDNTVVDRKLEDLKRKIVEVASQQPYWGEEIPARWLPLEEELMRLKAAGIKVISRNLLEDLNQAGAVQIATDELDLFLRFQHDIGTILYFSMEVLKDKIVLDPQWLIHAFKSLITAESFVLRSAPSVSGKWFEFKRSGKLSPELIDAVWTKGNNPDLHDNKGHILLLMEQLNIISKPRSYSEDGSEIKVENDFLAPCMLNETAPRDVIFPVPHSEMESSSVLCYVFMGKFLPSPIFHRLLATCVAHWPIAKKKSENLIFCGCCVFDLDLHHRLTVFFKDYIIFARVTRMGTTEKMPSFKLCIEVQKFITTTLSCIIGYLGQSLRFEHFIQCPKFDGYRVDCLIPVADLKGNVDVPCHFHDNSHVIMSHDVLKFWFQEADKEDSQPQQSVEQRELSNSEEDQEEEGHDDAVTPITQEHINHARLCNALTTVCANALRQVLISQVPVSYADIYHAILANQANLTSRRQIRPGQWQSALLNKDQSKLVFPDPQGRFTGKMDHFDISLLYTLIRNVSSVQAPGTRWGNPPTDQPRDTSLGASVERIRSYRNSISGHSVDGKISQQEFEDYWNKINDVLHDIENVIGNHEYQEELQKRKTQVITPHEARELQKTFKKYKKQVDAAAGDIQSAVDTVQTAVDTVLSAVKILRGCQK